MKELDQTRLKSREFAADVSLSFLSRLWRYFVAVGRKVFIAAELSHIENYVQLFCFVHVFTIILGGLFP